MDTTQDSNTRPAEQPARDSGMPGGGKGRKDEPGHTGVYPVSEMEGASGQATSQGEASWGQGDRGAAGYDDSGSSETFVVPPSGEPAPTRPGAPTGEKQS